MLGQYPCHVREVESNLVGEDLREQMREPEADTSKRGVRVMEQFLEPGY